MSKFYPYYRTRRFTSTNKRTTPRGPSVCPRLFKNYFTRTVTTSTASNHHFRISVCISPLKPSYYSTSLVQRWRQWLRVFRIRAFCTTLLLLWNVVFRTQGDTVFFLLKGTSDFKLRVHLMTVCETNARKQRREMTRVCELQNKVREDSKGILSGILRCGKVLTKDDCCWKVSL